MVLGGMIVASFLCMIWLSARIGVPQDLPFYLKPFYRVGRKVIGKEKREFYYIKLSFMLLVLFAGGAAALRNGLKEAWSSVLVEGHFIDRGGYGAGKKEYELDSVIGKEKIPVSVQVSGQTRREEELQELMTGAMTKLDMDILGLNASAEQVRTDLNLPYDMEEGEIQLEWHSSDYKIIETSGRVHNENIREEGEEVLLQAEMICRDQNLLYEKSIRVLPPCYSPEEELARKLENRIRTLDENSREEDRLELPVLLDGTAIQWRERPKRNSWKIILLSAAAAVLIFIGKEKDLQKLEEERRKQMLMDYPELVGKITLLLGAGMNIRSAFGKVAVDYREKKERQACGQRYAYEELLLAYYEIQGGIPEQRAYQNFGKRCRVQRYMKFSSLLAQNMKKGNAGLEKILEMEVQESLEERKAQAKKLGEEAGTRLLVPMFLMLVVVLIIVMAPALIAFQF